MSFSLIAIFQPDDRYEGVRRLNIYLLRLLYILMFFVLGREAWTQILTHRGPWEPMSAVASRNGLFEESPQSHRRHRRRRRPKPLQRMR